MANSEPTCRRVLVLAFDGTPNFADPYDAIAHWTAQMRGSRKFAVIPSLPVAFTSKTSTIIPSALQHLNAHFWTSDPGEVTSAVFSSAGITTEDYRVFISYRRGEGQQLADQLFEELNRRNFEVFLDQFRMEPGVNFQERLTEELAHKSMVVVIETRTIDQSRWVGHEVVYAVKHRLGLLAVHVADGATRPEVDNRRRMHLPASALDTDGELTSSWLDRVCKRVRIVHSTSILRRRYLMRQAMQNALLAEGIFNQQMTVDGLVEAQAPSSSSGVPNRIWLTPRPADVMDFQILHGKTDPRASRRPAVVAPGARLPGLRQAAVRWLSTVSNIHFFDESEMTQIARKISGGGL
jgi:hypothetical protein